MRVYEICYMGPLTEEVPTHLERLYVIESEPGQLGRYQNLVQGREVSLTVLASDEEDHLPMLIPYDMLDAENGKHEEAEKTDQGEDVAPVH